MCYHHKCEPLVTVTGTITALVHDWKFGEQWVKPVPHDRKPKPSTARAVCHQYQHNDKIRKGEGKQHGAQVNPQSFTKRAVGGKKTRTTRMVGHKPPHQLAKYDSRIARVTSMLSQRMDAL